MEKEIYQKIYNRTKKFYYGIKPVLSKSFNNEVILFGGSGWRHMIWKDGEMRPIEDRLRRFALLKFAAYVIRYGQIIHYRKDVKNGIVGKFWRLSLKIDKQYIKVVIRQIGTSSKHFFSVMN